MEHVTGKTHAISEFCDFNFYDLVWYHPGLYPNFNDENRALGRWLGVSNRIGSDMCYWILTKSGTVIAETTVQHVTRDDMLDATIAEQVATFNSAVIERLDDANFHIENNEGGFTLEDEYDLPQWDPAYGDNDPENNDESGTADGDSPLAEADDLDDDRYDKYIGAKLVLDEKSNNGGNLATVTKRATDEYGAPLGTAHRNPMLDTQEFEIELESGETDKIMANQIAANLYSQLDDEGREIMQFKGIIDHKADGSALTKETGFTILKGGNRKCKPTTRG